MRPRTQVTRRFAIALLMLAAAPWCAAAENAADTEVTVFAAASLTDVLQEIGTAFRAETGQSTRFSFAASSALARQIESGAPAHVFVSADVEWMDYLAERKLVDANSRRNVAGNDLVLIAPAGSTATLEVAEGFPIGAALGKGRLAVADPDSVPAGRYAKAALISLGVWQSVEQRLAPAENVRAALALVSRGETPLGIVYRTDAEVDPKVTVVGAFPEGSHAPIVYPAAAIGSSAKGAQFVEFLAGGKAQAAFRRFGFKPAP